MRKSLGTYRGSSFNKEGLATRTTGELHLYADGTSGDDNNDGLTAATPKKTLRQISYLIPDIRNNVVIVHLSGIFSSQGSLVWVRDTGGDDGDFVNVPIIIDGGDNWTDVGGSVFTTTGASTTSLVVAGAGWVTDAYAGYMVRILTGAAAGQTRTIQSHTVDTITPMRNFSVSPGVGATFDIIRPSTEIGTGTFIQTRLAFASAQRLYISGTGNVSPLSGTLTISNCIYNTSAVMTAGTATQILFSHSWYDTSVSPPSSQSANTGPSCGTSFISSSGFQYNQGRLTLAGVYASQVKLNSIFLQGIGTGTRIKYLELKNVFDNNEGSILNNTSGYATTKVNSSSGVGIKVEDSKISIGNGTIENNASHGIEAINSRVKFTTITVGTGNAGAGVYAHSGSVVHIKHGSPPTLTGTVGNVSTDGTTAATTWATVDGGTAYSDAIEHTLIKEVT